MNYFKKLILIIFVLFICLNTKLLHASNSIVGYVLNENGEESTLYKSNIPQIKVNETKSTLPILEKESSSINSCAIIGDDNRVTLKDYEYTLAPYRSVCRLTISFKEDNNTSYFGTGFLVGPHTVLTACHMVYDCSEEHDYGWFDNISISFGTYVNNDGYTINPYGVITEFSSVSCGSYRNTNKTDDDWALIELKTSIGDELGYFGLSSEIEKNNTLKTIAYYGDYYGNMGYSYGKVKKIDTYKFDHDCDITSGASGGAILKTDSNKVVGIVSSESSYWLFGTHYSNHACKISLYIINWVSERL